MPELSDIKTDIENRAHAKMAELWGWLDPKSFKYASQHFHLCRLRRLREP